MQKSVSIFVLQVDWVSFAVEEELKDRKVPCTRVEKQEHIVIIILYCIQSVHSSSDIFLRTFCVPNNFGMA